MTDDPSRPGATLRLYQAARLWLSSGGTWTVPSAFWPTWVIGARTPIAGISISVGTDGASAAATLTGSGPSGDVVFTVAGTCWAAAGGSLTGPVSACATTMTPTTSRTRPTARIGPAPRPWDARFWSPYPSR